MCLPASQHFSLNPIFSLTHTTYSPTNSLSTPSPLPPPLPPYTPPYTHRYNEHAKAVVTVLVDNKSPNIIHSVGADCSVLTYDLKAARRIISHLVTNGTLCSMTQRKDSENELITSDNTGRLLHWDQDYRDPVVAVQDPARLPVRAVAVSPSGRFLAFAGR